ncbi:MAG: spheroidene monooxygenase [Pseudomonadota bacterium]
MSRLAGLEFWKLCGSGTGEGFTPKPNTSVWGVLAVWQDKDTARETLKTRQPFAWYEAHAVESWTVFLRPTSARGAWSGRSPFAVAGGEPASASGAVVALTRATLKPQIAMQFWRRVPDISQMVGDNPDVMMKVGLGEMPLFRQITFSIWPDTVSMAKFARAPGPHAAAIKAVREEGWFQEELYARFEVLEEAGQWNGKQPVAAPNTAIAL